MTTFALVHGGWHGAWCWERVVPLLEERGHVAVAVDLPCDDQAAGLDTYADLVCRHLVYLCALVPDVGRSWMDQIADEPEMMCPGWNAGLSEPDSQRRTTWIDPHHTRELLYDDCDESTVESAITRIKPQVGLGSTPFALAEFPSASATSVICTEDRMVACDWAQRTARDRLGAEIIKLPGSHSPFFSRPGAVVDVLSSVAQGMTSAP